MTSRLNPHISFNGDALQPMELYKEGFGGTLVLNTFGEFCQADAPEANLIMQVMLESDAGLRQVADVPVSRWLHQHPMAADVITAALVGALTIVGSIAAGRNQADMTSIDFRAYALLVLGAVGLAIRRWNPALSVAITFL